MGNQRKKRHNNEIEKDDKCQNQHLENIDGHDYFLKNIKVIMWKKKGISLADKINIVMACLTFLSVIGVFVTLNEMKVQRNMSYSPSIVMNPVEVSFEWDEYGNESWLTTENQKIESSTEINEDGSITGTIKVPIIGLTEAFTKSTVINIGVGTAKNIVFKWDEENTKKLYDYLVSCNSEKEDFCVIGEESDVFTINEQLIMVDKENMIELMYMLPEAQEKYSFYFPAQYTILINEMIKSGYNECPPLFLHITYYDIQGKLKNDWLIIQIQRTFYYENSDASGKASYQLVPAFPSDLYK